MPTPEMPSLPPEVQAQLDSMLEAYANRPRYDAFDQQILASIPDAALEQALLDYLFTRLEGFKQDQDSAFAALSPQFRVFYCTWEVEAEVMNGGLNQYFWNSSAQNAERVPAALEAIGDGAAAELMREAIRLAVQELPEMSKYLKAGTLEAFSESYKHTSLNELDEPFCRRAEKFPALRLAFVRSQPEAFATPSNA
jgi:hypothetical protein